MPLEQLGDGEREERRDERRPLLVDVAAVEDRPHDRRVGRGAPDAALLEGLDEARLRVARGRARLVPCGSSADAVSSWPTASAGQPALLASSARLVATRRVGEHEAGEGDHRAARTEGRIAPSSAGGAELDRDPLARGVLHRGRDRPLEDQVVERELVPAQLAATSAGVRKTSPAGRIASWASGVFATARSYRRGWSEPFSGPCSREAWARAALSAPSESVTESRRM